MRSKLLTATLISLTLLGTGSAASVLAQEQVNPTQEQANPTTSQEEATPSTPESTPSAQEANPTTSEDEGTPSTPELSPAAEEANPTGAQEEGTFSILESTETTSAAVAAKPKLQLPFYCKQNWRLDTWAHAPALDMVKEPNQEGTNGATLLASASGTVNQSFYHKNAGNVIQINHGGGWFTTYLHLQSRTVKVGDKVQMGTVIGKVGKTGPTANNHPHLHFEFGYDSNKDGKASWGYKGSERVKPVFNGVTYGSKNGRTWRNVTSHNKCA